MKGLTVNKCLPWVGVLLSVVLLAACMPVQPVMPVAAQEAVENVDTVVNNIWREYESSLLAGDSDRWITLWVEDGVQMPPGSMPVEGRDAIAANNRSFLAEYTYTDFAINNLEANAADGWAYARGLYSGSYVAKAGGDPVVFEGKYMTILQKQADGSWKIYRDIFNPNAAPPAPSEPDVAEVTAEIEALWEEYAAANVAGDVDRYLALWDENGIQMPGGSPAIEGIENIKARKVAGFEKWDITSMTITNLEVEVVGDWAYVRGTYQSTRTPVVGGDTEQIDGKYMTILRKQPDGSWKLYRDISNSSVP